MLKWQVDGEEDHLIRMPHIMTWLLVAVYAAAFLIVVLGWLQWLALVLNYNQTLLTLLK